MPVLCSSAGESDVTRTLRASRQARAASSDRRRGHRAGQLRKCRRRSSWCREPARLANSENWQCSLRSRRSGSASSPANTNRWVATLPVVPPHHTAKARWSCGQVRWSDTGCSLNGMLLRPRRAIRIVPQPHGPNTTERVQHRVRRSSASPPPLLLVRAARACQATRRGPAKAV
jgi:hypothetical protein